MELKRLREKLRLSQTEVAKHLGVNSQTYNRYETGVNQPNIEMLIKLANFFNVSIDDLVGRESDTINLNFYDGNKKALLKYLIQEDDKTIERIFDFYKGLKYDLLNRAMGYQRQENIYNTNYNSAKSLFQNNIPSPIEQAELLSNLKNDPFFKTQFKNNNNDKDENK